MYAPFFGLRQEPFSIAPDPRFLFMSERHREALAHLLYGLAGGGGFVLLTGEIGTGKTTVCRCFLEQIPASCNVAYIFNPKLTVEELLRTVGDEFHVPGLPAPGSGATVKAFIDPLNRFLLDAHAAGKTNVLVIDEAQNLSAQVLEQLRLLTNLETSQRKLLQIILIGQPELRDMLARPELEQLAQRVTARFHLDALTLDETAQYVAHRLTVAGLVAALPFEPAVVRRIHRLSRGIPRRINLLCDRALLGAYGSGQTRVGAATLQQAAVEVFGPDRPVGRQRSWIVAATAAGIAALAWWVWRPDADPTPPRPPQAASAPPIKRASAVGAAATDAASVQAASHATGASAPARPVEPLGLLQLQAWLSGMPARTQDDAWRALAGAWQTQAVGRTGPVCVSLEQEGLNCYRGTASLALIRQLDRPGIVNLHLKQQTAVPVGLVGLTRDAATLTYSGQSRLVSLDAMAQLWRGDFATLWRAPAAGMGVGDGHWWRAPLGRLMGDGTLPELDEAGWREKVFAFQLAQGLVADGVAGPITFMQINRAAGVAEPHLNRGN